ncbi:hypothetical protein CRYUN_Cryun03dG0057500 [Craigia yunnanensis]
MTMALPFFRTHFIALFVVTLCLISHLPFMSNAQDAGTATFYTPPYSPCACCGYEEQGSMIAAASDEIWNDERANVPIHLYQRDKRRNPISLLGKWDSGGEDRRPLPSWM